LIDTKIKRVGDVAGWFNVRNPIKAILIKEIFTWDNFDGFSLHIKV